jgi:hypothetical protein
MNLGQGDIYKEQILTKICKTHFGTVNGYVKLPRGTLYPSSADFEYEFAMNQASMQIRIDRVVFKQLPLAFRARTTNLYMILS